MDSTIEPNTSELLKTDEPPTCEPTPQKNEAAEGSEGEEKVGEEWNGKTYDY